MRDQLYEWNIEESRPRARHPGTFFQRHENTPPRAEMD